jgi:hypothetical protein
VFPRKGNGRKRERRCPPGLIRAQPGYGGELFGEFSDNGRLLAHGRPECGRRSERPRARDSRFDWWVSAAVRSRPAARPVGGICFRESLSLSSAAVAYI